jgi:catechol 2,3-dioxygenase-like lactoylglutathione lyase family enzyme
MTDGLMLDHLSITVSDIAAAERFYDAVMKELGVVKVGRREDWLGYGERASAAYPERVYISIRKGERPDNAPGRHWCFKAKSRTRVDAFWDAGIAAGGSDHGPPGLRSYHASYYAAFLRDPDGNPIEAVCHHAV